MLINCQYKLHGYMGIPEVFRQGQLVLSSIWRRVDSVHEQMTQSVIFLSMLQV